LKGALRFLCRLIVAGDVPVEKTCAVIMADPAMSVWWVLAQFPPVPHVPNLARQFRRQ
jgi:hypothetical protein